VQRCRIHTLRNVGAKRLLERLAHAGQKRDAWGLQALSEGRNGPKLRRQAKWLAAEHPDARASLQEGLEESFTVNRLKLTPALIRCLASTNIIENPKAAVRRVTGRVTRWRNPDMVLRWATAAFLEAEKSFRLIQGHRDLWVLAVALGREPSTKKVDAHAKAA
jgi:putative transposase